MRYYHLSNICDIYTYSTGYLNDIRAPIIYDGIFGLIFFIIFFIIRLLIIDYHFSKYLLSYYDLFTAIEHE